MNLPVETELKSSGATFTPLELKLPEAMPMQDWAELGRKLCRTDQVVKWWLGDWAAFGERKYGKLKEFAEMNNLNYQTLANLCWVSSSVELSRRRETLEWSKHAEVAALKPKEQAKWLAKAESGKWPVVELRKQIRLSGGEYNALKPDGKPIDFIFTRLDDLTHWLFNRPADFWTADRRQIWRERTAKLVSFLQAL